MSSEPNTNENKQEEKEQQQQLASSSGLPWYRTVNWHSVILYSLLVGVTVKYAWDMFSTKQAQRLREMKLQERINLTNKMRATPGGRFPYSVTNNSQQLPNQRPFRREGVKALVHFPHSYLTQPASLVTESDRSRTMWDVQINALNQAAHKLQCLSFSAPKIKWDAQVILLKATPDVDDYEVFVNPEVPGYDAKDGITSMYGMWENCVCCSSLHAWVQRPQKITVKAQDMYGETRTTILEGVRARLLMHELDHLRGTSYLQQVASTDFIVSSAALAQQDLWPAHFPSMEARMTGMNQAFDYVTNTVVIPPGLEWVSAISHSFMHFRNNRIEEDKTKR